MDGNTNAFIIKEKEKEERVLNIKTMMSSGM